MHRTIQKTERLCEIYNDLMRWAETNKDCTDVKTMGEVIDMIKDIAEAEEKCWKSCYYKSIVEAMEEAEEWEKMEYMDEEGRMGYDNWRYASGRFAPKGRGHKTGHRGGRMGYVPYYDDGGDMNDHEMWGRNADQMKHPYEKWKTTRLGYQSDHDPAKKTEMDAAAKEHVLYVADTMKDIWNDADPALRQELKSKLGNLMAELK